MLTMTGHYSEARLIWQEELNLNFPSSPELLWSIKTGARTKSSPVISEGTVYFGNDKGSLIAVSTDGKIKWKYESGTSIDAAPMVFGKKVILVQVMEF